MTGPTERKMTINALNSGAQVWLADMEDASTPHWHNVIGGQVNLYDAIRETITFTSPEGKAYALADGPRPTIVVRPRGWHLDERHITVDGEMAVGALVDFGLYFFHNAAELLARGCGPYFYLPKLESHLEARLWNDVFTFAESYVGVRARLGAGHGAHRDDPGRVRDGGDPLRTARPRRRAERRAVGLPVQPDQELPRLRRRLRPAGTLDRHDGRAVHAGVLRPAGQDLPPPRRVRHRRDGRVHPQPRSGRERHRVRQGARGQAARGRRRFRRLLGGPSRAGAGVPGDLRRRPRRRAQPARPPARRRRGRRRRNCWTCVPSRGS